MALSHRSGRIPLKHRIPSLVDFLGKALGGENHLAPRVINTDEHAGYPPAIVWLKSVSALEENCRHRPVQNLNNALESGSPGNQKSGARKPEFCSFWSGS